MSERIIDVLCVNCGYPASEMFDEIPDHVFKAPVWYCCQDCYEEYTKDEG